MRKIAVIGSRSFNDYARLECLLLPWLPATIITGGAKGADALAERFARENGLCLRVIKPDWKQYGRGAGPIRNREIVDAAELIIAFWDGRSRGTLSAINYARGKGKAVIVDSGEDMIHQELLTLITTNGNRYLACVEEWEADIIEWQTFYAIFEYAARCGFQAPDYNIRAILDADDDESPGVPDIGCEAALIDLMERISTPDHADSIDAPEIRALLSLMETAFGRGET